MAEAFVDPTAESVAQRVGQAASIADESRAIAGGARAANLKLCVVAAAASAAWLVPIVWILTANPRVLSSWHGFLHAAIAGEVHGLARPEDPFFGGEALPYYWFHQLVASCVARGLAIDALHALALVTLVGLVVLVATGVFLGRNHCGSLRLGLLIGALALCGSNLGGPFIALARHAVEARPLFLRAADAAAPATVFISDREANRLQAQPWLPLLSVTDEWRHGPNLVWFLDSSSRGVTLAGVLLLAGLLVGRVMTVLRLVGVTVVAALVCALNPLIGLATIGALALCAVAIPLLDREGPADEGTSERRGSFAAAGACIAGALLALPTYYHLFFLGTPLVTFSAPGLLVQKVPTLVASFAILVPLAVLGSNAAAGAARSWARRLTAAALALLLACCVLHLPQGNEHNFSNAAQVLLAFPAAAFWGPRRPGCRNRWPRSTRALPALITLLVVSAGATLAAFCGLPGAPLAFGGSALHRADQDGSLERLYGWVRDTTPARALFLADPDRPVKMSGNVAEFPAFTGRALFVGSCAYLMPAHRDLALRREIVKTLLAGRPLRRDQVGYLRLLERPLFLVSYDAASAEALDALTRRYGPPVFRAGFVAVFAIAPEADERGRAGAVARLER